MIQEVCNIPQSGSFWSQGLISGILTLAADLLGVGREGSPHASDEELARRMNGGDDQAFEQLYERYFDKVYAFVLRRVGDRPVAEDVTSDVFMKAFAHRRAFVWKTSFSAWIYRIATNRITDHYRSKKPTEELDEEHHDRPDGQESAPQEMDRQLLGKKLEQVLETLNERERIAVTMKYYGEYDNQEIAEALGCTANNAGVILHRALKKCQTHYAILEKAN